MARARNIKPGICKNEDLAACSIAARYLFACLPMWADREGRLEDRPLRLKIEIFPADAVDVDDLLNELAGHGTPPFVVRYQNSAGRFIQITRFQVHQSPHYSEKPSVIKPPLLPESTVDDGSSTPGNSSSPSTKTPGALLENSGSDPPIKRGSQPPDSLIHRFSDSLIPDSHDSPIVGKNKARKRAAIRPETVSEAVWDDFTAARTAKRAPLTQTALHGIEREAKKAGLTLQAALEISCARGWQGFNAGWLNGSKPHGNTDAAAEAKRRIFGEEKDVTDESTRL